MKRQAKKIVWVVIGIIILITAGVLLSINLDKKIQPNEIQIENVDLNKTVATIMEEFSLAA